MMIPLCHHSLGTGHCLLAYSPPLLPLPRYHYLDIKTRYCIPNPNLNLLTNEAW